MRRLRAGEILSPGPQTSSSAEGSNTPGTMIAATAIANGLPLYTANPSVFAGIDGLVVRDVRSPGWGE